MCSIALGPPQTRAASHIRPVSEPSPETLTESPIANWAITDQDAPFWPWVSDINVVHNTRSLFLMCVYTGLLCVSAVVSINRQEVGTVYSGANTPGKINRERKNVARSRFP